ncbi:MAG: hypothetical protein P8Y45_16845, partial [Exilibacterium sp.]
RKTILLDEKFIKLFTSSASANKSFHTKRMTTDERGGSGANPPEPHTRISVGVSDVDVIQKSM